jgi:hypothetical protein
MSDRVPRVSKVSACYSMLAGEDCKESGEKAPVLLLDTMKRMLNSDNLEYKELIAA